MKAKKLGAIIVGACLLGGIMFGFASTEKIKNGHVGVVYSINGGVKDEVLGQGLKFVGIGKKVIQYSVRTQQLYMSRDEQEGSKNDDSLNIGTQGGTVNADFEMSYSFNPETVANVYKKYGGLSGKEIVDGIVRGRIRGLVNEVTSRYSVADVYIDKKQEVNEAITNHLQENLSEIGITVERSSLSEVRPDEQIMSTIKDKAIMQEELAVEEKKQEKVALEAETKRIEAQGEADKKLIEAQAEADANKLLEQSITPELIKMKEAEARLKHGWVTVQGADTVVTPVQ